MRTVIRVLMIAAALCGLAGTARAQVPLDGALTATTACPAVQSIKKGSNPGNIRLVPGQTYEVVGKNRDEASHYFVIVPAAVPDRRWVDVSCGTLAGADGSAPPKQNSVGTANPAEKPKGAFFILAISWQPAFCEAHPGKRECESQTAQRYDASRFTLHGLWPQPRDNIYCGVPANEVEASAESRWSALPPLALSSATASHLDQVMPGRQSLLDRHEWTKHGTCYAPQDPETYFRDSLRLMDEINASAAQTLVAAKVGRTIQAAELRDAFDQSFGPGAGDRLRFACKSDGGRQLLTEITLGLKGDIAAGTPLADLLMASNPTDPGCPSFVIDPVGLQ